MSTPFAAQLAKMSREELRAFVEKEADKYRAVITEDERYDFQTGGVAILQKRGEGPETRKVVILNSGLRPDHDVAPVTDPGGNLVEEGPFKKGKETYVKTADGEKIPYDPKADNAHHFERRAHSLADKTDHVVVAMAGTRGCCGRCQGFMIDKHGEEEFKEIVPESRQNSEAYLDYRKHENRDAQAAKDGEAQDAKGHQPQDPTDREAQERKDREAQDAKDRQAQDAKDREAQDAKDRETPTPGGDDDRNRLAIDLSPEELAAKIEANRQAEADRKAQDLKDREAADADDRKSQDTKSVEPQDPNDREARPADDVGDRRSLAIDLTPEELAARIKANSREDADIEDGEVEPTSEPGSSEVPGDVVTGPSVFDIPWHGGDRM